MRRLLLKVVLLSFLPAVSYSQAAKSHAEACVAPDAKAMASVAEYVAAKYHAGTPLSLTLKSASQANADCYWKLDYEVLTTHKPITLYLTPDRKYLLPALFDRSSDPLAEEREARLESEKALTAGHAASAGSKTASVTIVEFSDFQCPYCQRLATVLEKDVLPSDPDVHVVFRNFPLSMHPWAQPAAQIAACAQMQSDAAFWKLHDYLFASQKELTAANVTEKLVAYADTVPGIQHDAFHDCVDEGLTVGPVSKDVALGNRFGVRATPTMFINGSKVDGVRDAAQMKQLIAQARSGQLPAATASANANPTTTNVARAGSPSAAQCDPPATR